MKPSDSVLVRNFVAFPAGPESIGIVEAGSPRSQTIQKAVSTLHFPNVKGSMLNLAHAASAAPVLSTRPEPPMRTRTSGRSAGPNAGLVSGSRGATELFAALGELEKAAVEAPKGYDLVARKLETEYTSVFKEFGGWIRRKLKRSGSTAEHGRR